MLTIRVVYLITTLMELLGHEAPPNVPTTEVDCLHVCGFCVYFVDVKWVGKSQLMCED